ARWPGVPGLGHDQRARASTDPAQAPDPLGQTHYTGSPIGGLAAYPHGRAGGAALSGRRLLGAPLCSARQPDRPPDRRRRPARRRAGPPTPWGPALTGPRALRGAPTPPRRQSPEHEQRRQPDQPVAVPRQARRPAT